MLYELLAGIRRTPRALMGNEVGALLQAPHSDDLEQMTLDGNCYMASLQAAVALGTALTATAVTLTLYNPPGSGKRLVLLQATVGIVVATTAGFIVHAVNGTVGQVAPATTTALASGVQNCLVGGGANNVGIVYSAATLPAAPVARRIIAGIVSTTPGGFNTLVDPVKGSIVLKEGMMTTVQGVTTNATGVISYLWREVDN